ncbi:hypothetical protein BDK51DRAFT_45662 [Blyttiomyces helicus]|uniref:ditrans,polycis-polyprenyl diphosphate synthase [(2E,6E)-farnesyldiphosphate specific] n=1 Tax=Blyttiomyces helicus TaxID=388810 RepID=A0A4P9WJ51_9FUNG|nr:hypothetical protein BDK51DRAFT_45662 [Blyttiomyces helicus]|eukprot:RKO92382.1 hypothetical protein BDK51DRAFT_45662 [Blyttiomyces helicus]
MPSIALTIYLRVVACLLYVAAFLHALAVPPLPLFPETAPSRARLAHDLKRVGQKRPRHVAVVLASPREPSPTAWTDRALRSVAEVACWAVASGALTLTVFDEEGALKSKSADLAAHVRESAQRFFSNPSESPLPNIDVRIAGIPLPHDEDEALSETGTDSAVSLGRGSDDDDDDDEPAPLDDAPAGLRNRKSGPVRAESVSPRRSPQPAATSLSINLMSDQDGRGAVVDAARRLAAASLASDRKGSERVDVDAVDAILSKGWRRSDDGVENMDPWDLLKGVGAGRSMGVRRLGNLLHQGRRKLIIQIESSGRRAMSSKEARENILFKPGDVLASHLNHAHPNRAPLSDDDAGAVVDVDPTFRNCGDVELFEHQGLPELADDVLRPEGADRLDFSGGDVLLAALTKRDNRLQGIRPPPN